MSGTSTTSFTASAIVPNQLSWGHYQRFTFPINEPLVKLQAFSEFVPTTTNDSIITIESRNFNYGGFRWRHLTKSTDVNYFGSFKFQSFISDGPGTDIYGFDGTNFNLYVPVFVKAQLDMGGFKIVNLGTPTVGTDAATKAYVDSSVAGGLVTLVGNVTGSGDVGTSITTTLNMTLDTIPHAVAAVNLNTHQINNLAMAGSPASTDAVNVSYLNTKIAAGTIVLTGNVTGSGTVGTSFPTTIVSTLDAIPVAVGNVNLNSQAIDSVSNIGVGVASSATFPMQFANTIAQCKLSLYPGGGTPNIFQTYGFGILSSTLAYNIASNSAAHVFYCGASSTTSSELFRIAGTGAVTMQGALNLNTHQINGLSMAGSPAGTDAVNVTYLNSKIAAGTIVLTGDVTGSGVVGTSFPTTMTLTLDQIPLAAAIVNLNSQSIENVGNLGIGVASPSFGLQFAAATAQLKICLFSGGNSFQSYGFGIAANTLIYSVLNSSASHVFYCGASSSTSTELFRIAGASSGYASVSGGNGPMYCRVPSAQVYLSSNSTTTSCVANTLIKIAGTTTASGNEVGFTTSTTNRLTFTGTNVSTCVGMASGTAMIYGTADLQTLGICIVKNGSTQLLPIPFTTSRFSGSAFPMAVSVTDVLVSLSATDYLELWIVCGATANIKVSAMSLSFKAS